MPRPIDIFLKKNGELTHLWVTAEKNKKIKQKNQTKQNKTENSRKQFNAAMTILCKINELLEWMIKKGKEQTSERGLERQPAR